MHWPIIYVLQSPLMEIVVENSKFQNTTYCSIHCNVLTQYVEYWPLFWDFQKFLDISRCMSDCRVQFRLKHNWNVEDLNTAAPIVIPGELAIIDRNLVTQVHGV